MVLPVIPFVVPVLTATAGGVLAWIGYKAGDTTGKIKTYTFYGVVAFGIYFFVFRKK